MSSNECYLLRRYHGYHAHETLYQVLDFVEPLRPELRLVALVAVGACFFSQDDVGATGRATFAKKFLPSPNHSLNYSA